MKYLLIVALFLSVNVFAQEQYVPQKGDIITYRDALAEIKEAEIASGLTFGMFFLGITLEWASHDVLVVDPDTVVQADGVNMAVGVGVWQQPLQQNLLRVIGPYTVHRLKTPCWLPAFVRTWIIDRWVAKAQAKIGQPYDIQFQWDTDVKQYCSKMILQAFKEATFLELVVPVLVSDLNWQPFAPLLAALGIDVAQKVVTPAGLVKSVFLEQVYGPVMEVEELCP